MQPNYTPHQQPKEDSTVQRLAQEYGRLSEAQQICFQQTLLNATTTSAQDQAEEHPTTWEDIAHVVGPIEWEWKGWLAKGFLTIIASESGMGKSYLSLKIAACYLEGQDWPDGKPFTEERGAVLWCEAEAAQALNLDRAKQLRLPIDRIYTPLPDPLNDIDLGNQQHQKAILNLAHRPELKLIIVDSLRGAHRGDEDASDIFGTVRWLAQLARDTVKPVILIHHLRKRGLTDTAEITLDRLRGSSAIVQPARIVWALDRPDLTDHDTKRLSVIKSNLGKFPPPLGLTIDESGVHFGAVPEPPKIETQKDRATELLISLLEDEPVAASDIESAAKANGISTRTLNAAKAALGIVSVKTQGKNGRWMWSLPAKDANG
jgi:putative DNA primase/helicase